MSTPEPRPLRGWTGAAIALVVIGAVILTLSGLCTAAVGGAGIVSMFVPAGTTGNGLGSGLAMMALIFGGPFIVLGALLIRTGLRERKRPK